MVVLAANLQKCEKRVGNFFFFLKNWDNKFEGAQT